MTELNAFIRFEDGYYNITNEAAPGFLLSYNFQDEYEANLAWAIWLQYSKLSKPFPNSLVKSIDNFAYQWILKAVFRIIGVKSNWGI